MIGFRLQRKHSYFDYGLCPLDRKITIPERKRYEETVAYSNVRYDFSALFGGAVYSDRKLWYKFELCASSNNELTDKITRIAEWLNFSGAIRLYDDLDTSYYYNVYAPQISVEPICDGIAQIEMTFVALPLKHPRESLRYTASSFPDINGDGRVDASDATLILNAAAESGNEESSSFTPAQKVLADVDKDGSITAKDAAIVTEFAAASGIGRYENSPEGWVKFMTEKIDREEGVL